MKKTFVDVMLELPVDATLRDFLTAHGLPVPGGFTWDDTPETSQFLVEAVKVWPDTAARDQMTANLMASVQLGDAAGKQAMFEAVVADGAALAGLTLCSSDVHRSFWLYVNHPVLFERAYDFSFWEHHGQQTQQYDLGLKRQPNGSDAPSASKAAPWAPIARLIRTSSARISWASANKASARSGGEGSARCRINDRILDSAQKRLTAVGRLAARRSNAGSIAAWNAGALASRWRRASRAMP